jgi:large subunit ribosomal protein L20
MRIKAAAREHGISYSQLMASFRARGVTPNRKVLADLAVRDPAAIAALVTAK